jgi:hypothetical protein
MQNQHFIHFINFNIFLFCLCSVPRGCGRAFGEVQLGEQEADGPGPVRLCVGAPLQDREGPEAAGKPHARHWGRRIR